MHLEEDVGEKLHATSANFKTERDAASWGEIRLHFQVFGDCGNNSRNEC